MLNNQAFNIIADANMPLVDELFAEFGNITKIDGRQIQNVDLIQADILLCRSITQVDQNLLKNTPVKFVGTATIGIDHLDIPWLEQQNIHWASAAGCNAAAVAQYVLSGICAWCLQHNKSIDDLTVGIVGAGNVGTQLVNYLKDLNVKFLLCDPPLEEKADKREFVDLTKILKCDVITLHVPSTFSGKYPTHHMINKKLLEQLSHNQLLINSSRGNVVNNLELLDYLNQNNATKTAKFILDVFENEPNINQELIEKCFITTPHIAGHTLEGKLRGTVMIHQAFCEQFNLFNDKKLESLYPKKNKINLLASSIEEKLLEIYDIQKDATQLLKFKNQTQKILPEYFDDLRKNYLTSLSNRPRRDYSGWLCEEASGISFLNSIYEFD